MSLPSGLIVIFLGDVRCSRSADGNSMQLRGQSPAGWPGAAGATCDTEFIWQDDSLPALAAQLDGAQLSELSSAAQLPRRFELRSGKLQWQFTARAVQVHRSAGGALFAAIPPRPVPAWLRAAWWLLLSALRLPGIGRLLLSARGAA